MEKMTKKNAYMMAIEALNAGEYSDNKEAAIEILSKEIDRLNSVAEKASTKRAAKAEAKANDLIERINSVFNNHEGIALSASDVTTYINDENITKSKVSYRLGRMVKNNILSKEVISSKDENGKIHRMTVYLMV